MKQQEIRRKTRGKMMKKQRKKKRKMANKSRHDFVAVLLATFDSKTGDFLLRFWPFLRTPIEITATDL